MRSIRHNVFNPLQSIGITHWAKGGQYPSETKVTAAYCGTFRENVKRAHFQACICKAALQHPLVFGWASEGPSGAYGFDGHGYTSNKIFLFSIVLVAHTIQQLLYEHGCHLN